MLTLEQQVLTALDFDLQFESPTNFMDRFEVLIGSKFFLCSKASK